MEFNMDNILLYRKRFIPNETIFLKDDIVIEKDENYIVTKWKTLKPRNDFSWGLSCYILDRGFKISRFFSSSGEQIYWYCDIIKYEVKGNKYIFTDLLADVIVYPDGKVKVMDLAELAQMFEKGIINNSDVCEALNKLDNLLNEIYSGNIEKLAYKII